MQIGLIGEVVNDGRICMLPTAFNAIRNLVLANIDGRNVTEFQGQKALGSYMLSFSANGGEVKFSKDFVADGDEIKSYVRLGPNDRFVNMVTLCGPMTRNGAACSIGTKGIRDKMMRAADDAHCRGHIIYCDTPGGMSSSVQDLRLAIDYVHQRGQKVYMIIDGMAASAGAFVAAMCDKVLYINPDDQIGSIGMYAAFFTLADGAKNTITSEVYHEYYATASADKNQVFRAASEGDMSAVAEMIDTSLNEMLEQLKTDRPSILPEQMTGKMYKVSEVEGSLVDGQSTLIDAARELFEQTTSSASATPAQPAANNQQPKNTVMKTYKHIGLVSSNGETEALESADGTVFLDETRAEALEQHLAAEQSNAGRVEELTNQLEEERQHAAAQLAAQAETSANLQTQLDAANAEIENLRATLEAAQQTASETAEQLSTANASLATTTEQLTTANAEIDNLRQTNDSLGSENANLHQQVADLTTQVDEMNAAAGQQPQAGATPANNGAAAPKPQQVVATSCSFDPSLSAEENAKRYAAARARGWKVV